MRADSQSFDAWPSPYSPYFLLETPDGMYATVRPAGLVTLFLPETQTYTTVPMPPPDGVSAGSVTDRICATADGSVWAGTTVGYASRRGVGDTAFHAVPTPAGSSSSYVGCRATGEVLVMRDYRPYRYTPSGTYLGELTDPSVSRFGKTLAGCPDGSLWMLAEPVGAGRFSLARLSPTDRLDFFHSPNMDRYLSDAACASDGGAWFTLSFTNELGQPDGGMIGRVFPDGRVVEYEVPLPRSGPGAVIEGPDGAAWFTSWGIDSLGRLDDGGRFTFVGHGVFGFDLILGTDGNLWFSGLDSLVRFTLPPYRQTVPAVVGTSGVGGVPFTTDLSVANWGSSPATLTLRYVPSRPSSGSFEASVTEVLLPGRQLLLDDALAWFRSKGFPVPGTGNVGTVSVEATSALPWRGVSAIARTTSPSGSGRSGVSYPAWAVETLPSGPGRTQRLFGLRQTVSDRTNLGLVNASTSASVSLRVSLVPASGAGERVVFPEFSLGPGGWTQLDSLLIGTGLTEAWAEVSSLGAEEAPFGAYAVVNDAATNDGSFLAPQEPSTDLILPALVDTGTYRTELLLANPGSVPATAELTFVPAEGPPGTSSVLLAPFEQRIVPGAASTLALGSGVGPLFVRFAQGSGVAAARVATPDGYGVFLTAIPRAGLTSSKVRVTGLRQGNGVRSNLALVNADEAPLSLEVTLVDGETGTRQPSTTVTLPARGFVQLNLVLLPSGLRQGWAEVERRSGTGRFVVYGVVNDGERQGEGTGDGSVLPMATEN